MSKSENSKVVRQMTDRTSQPYLEPGQLQAHQHTPQDEHSGMKRDRQRPVLKM
jgi:hypothetical protein